MRAENGTQTRDPQLGRLVLYRLSYFRKNSAGRDFCASLRFVELQKQAFARLAEDFRSLPFFRGPRHNLLWWGKRRHASLLLRQAQSVRPRCRTRGCGWIRTTEAEKQQIYSLPHLATLEHTPKHLFQCSLVSRFLLKARASCRTRTNDRLITNRVLYQLS